MPIYDIQCSSCKKITPDILTFSYRDPLPPCDCGGIPEKLWTTATGYKPFAAFTETINGREVTIDSVAKIRQIERETAASGKPHIWRAYSQDRSNLDKNIFGEAPTMESRLRDAGRLTASDKEAARDLQQRIKGRLGLS